MNSSTLKLIGGAIMVMIILMAVTFAGKDSTPPASSPTPPIDTVALRVYQDSVKQAGAVALAAIDSAKAEARREFAALRRHFECHTDSIYGTAWFDHENQTVQNSWHRSYLDAPVSGSGYTYLRSHFTGDDWVFHDHIVVRINDVIMESAEVPTYDKDNSQTNSSGTVWESINFTRDRDNGIYLAIALHPESRVHLRFVGRRDSHDEALAERDRRALSESYRLAEAIKAIGGVTCSAPR